MSTGTIVLLVILALLIIGVVVLYFVGKKAQKRQAEQQEQINAAKQTVSMLIIDKKRMKIKESGLPQAVIAQTPRLMRGSKLPIVKAKIGPQIMSLVCDEAGSKSNCQRHLYYRCERLTWQANRSRTEKERLLQACDGAGAGKSRCKTIKISFLLF